MTTDSSTANVTLNLNTTYTLETLIENISQQSSEKLMFLLQNLLAVSVV